MISSGEKRGSRVEPDTNLFTYLTLEGRRVIENKIKGLDREYAEGKRRLLEDVVSATRNYPGVLRSESLLRGVLEALQAYGYSLKVCRVKAQWRVLAGAGGVFGKIPFEVGLSFDPVLNLPYIPGSSLKGAFRDALFRLAEKEKGLKKAEEIADCVFGSNDSVGLVGVTDAYPVALGVDGLLFEPDVLTPHYPGAKDELDVSPNPVPFLTVAREVQFEFYVYFNSELRRKLSDERPGGDHKLECVEHILEEDLMEAVSKRGGDVNLVPLVDRAVLYALARGVGAKTSLGYSRFELVEYKYVRG
ncbi:MAG: type III-B CRISPR module RAMP protein Cmr6 [Infirmifilum sp.]